MRRACLFGVLSGACLFVSGCNEILGMDAGQSSSTGSTSTTTATGGAGGSVVTGTNVGGGASGGSSTGTGTGPEPSHPSCAGVPATCGVEGTLDCCESLFLTGYKFPMGRGAMGSDAYADGKAWEQPEHEVTVSDFFLDRFEVTVGRFRTFLAQYDGTPPAPDAGAHPLIPGSGWKAEWDAELLTHDALVSQLHCHPLSTWTDSPGENENKPMACAKWYEMFLFCLWDGGRLPTEAEWEYAAAGGLSNNRFPWGVDFPTAMYAATDCSYGGSPGTCTSADIPPVGSFPLGESKNGVRDLAGSFWEYTLDKYSDVWYAQGGSTCHDCANLDMPSTMGRSIRGGAFDTSGAEMRAARRDSIIPTYRAQYLGFRCARSP